MRLVLALLFVAVSTAQADPAADVTKAFTSFVEGVAATGKPSAGIDLLITPFSDSAPVATDLSTLKGVLEKPKVKIAKLVVSKSGKSAWLLGDVTARLSRNGKVKSDALRASAVLELDGGAWRVRATEWSATMPNRRLEGCGMIDFEMNVASDVPKDLVAPVKAVADAYRAMPSVEGGPVGGGDRAPLLKLLSDDPNAVTLGSAAGERFTGGAAIKALFKNWNITLVSGDGGDKSIPARARATGDGELLWIYLGTMSHAQCTHYRTVIVLAKEAAGWRIVHQHFSVPFSS
jgi:ketosteroid isomerase-like protein